MNLLQLARQAQFEIDALRTGNVASALWSAEEVYAAINTAADSAYRIARLVGSDIVTKTLLSTDAAVDLITESYAPSSLRLVSGTIDYTMPPDVVSIVNIAPITSGFDGIMFKPLRPNQKTYVDQRVIPSAELGTVVDSEANFFFFPIGRRTLRIVPTPQDTIDIEFIYNYRPPKLMTYSTGTIEITAGAPTTVTGTSTVWVDVGLRTPAEYINGTVATVVDLGLYYPTISSFTSNTVLTLSKSHATVAASGAYRIAMVPVLPEQHHAWLAQMAAAVLFRKVNLETSNQAITNLEKQLLTEIKPEIEQRQIMESIPVEPYELP